MADTIFVRLRVEYKGPDKDVDTPAPVSVQLAKGSTVLDLLNMAEHHDARYSHTTNYVDGCGHVVVCFCGIFNSKEDHCYWFFYSPAAVCLDKPISRARLDTGEEVVARYEKLDDHRDDMKLQLAMMHH